MAHDSPLYYGDYLQLDKILDSQHRRSEEAGDPAHEEMLFIIVHQAYELWFKQVLFELDSVREIFSSDFVEEKEIATAVSRLKRITEIQKLLVQQLKVLETMAPQEFLEFRDYLFPASGFQSFQFRLVENKMGLELKKRLSYQKSPYYKRLSEKHQELVNQSEKEPSLLEVVEKWLERTPFLEFGDFEFWSHYRKAVEEMLAEEKAAIDNNQLLSEEERQNQYRELEKTERNFRALLDKDKHQSLVEKGYRRLSHRATQAALLIFLYRDEPILHLPFQLLNTLVEIDELWATWRHGHALMVHRMIGTKLGTGGSSGYSYLKSTVEKHRVFWDFFQLSTYLLPHSTLPDLPEELVKKLNFYHSAKEGE